MNSANKFQNFWSEKINYMNSLQINYKVEKTSFSQFENIEFYNLTFNSFDNSTIYAKYIKNIKYRTLYPNKAIPILFYFHGYPASSRNWLEKSTFVSLGYDVVAIDFRNQGGLSKDKSNSSPSVFGHLTIGLDENIEDMIFYKNILDALILSRIVTSFDEVDSKNIITYGAWYCTQKVGQNIKLFWFSILNFKVSKFYYF